MLMKLFSSWGLWLLSTGWVISGFTIFFGNIWSPEWKTWYTHTHSAAVFPPHITWHSVPENPSRQVLTSQHGNSFTQSLSSPDAFHHKQSGNPSARLWEGVIKRRVKTDPNPPEHRECLYSQPSNTHKSSAPTHASLKPNQCNAKGCLESVLFTSL